MIQTFFYREGMKRPLVEAQISQFKILNNDSA